MSLLQHASANDQRRVGALPAASPSYGCNMTQDSSDTLLIRTQAVRRIEYGWKTASLMKQAQPSESDWDTALTNGLLAIVAAEAPGKECQGKGLRLHPASKLLEILKALGLPEGIVHEPTLREGLEIGQPIRHGGSDDENDGIGSSHVKALVSLDQHWALNVLKLVRNFTTHHQLCEEVYAQVAVEAGPFDLKDQLMAEDTTDCAECGRETFLPDGLDAWGWTSAAGRCATCGYVVTWDEADDSDMTAAILRAVNDGD